MDKDEMSDSLSTYRTRFLDGSLRFPFDEPCSACGAPAGYRCDLHGGIGEYHAARSKR